MLTDAEAKDIALTWHGGGGSALYALGSTGAIDTARADHDAYREIRECIDLIETGFYGLNERGWWDEDLNDLAELVFYVAANGKRSPVEGWNDLPVFA